MKKKGMERGTEVQIFHRKGQYTSLNSWFNKQKNKDEKLSNNTNIARLKIKNYDIDFKIMI